MSFRMITNNIVKKTFKQFFNKIKTIKINNSKKQKNETNQNKKTTKCKKTL